MKISVVDEVQSTDPNKGLQVRDGGANRDFRVLFGDDAPDGFNFWFGRTVQNDEGDDAFVSPRHKHTFQQIKFCEKGALDVTPDLNIYAGELGFFPKGAYYGPQRRERGLTSWVVQYGFNGEHQRGDYWEAGRAEALQRLKARGRVENGLYIERNPETGETTTRDSVDALYNERHLLLKGVPLKISEPTYDAPIIFHPQNMPYYDAAPGLELKQLGHFFDQPGPNGDVSLFMARLSGGVLDLSADRPQIVWTVDAGLKADGRVCPGAAAVYSPRGEPGQVSGENGLEVYVVEFPRLD